MNRYENYSPEIYDGEEKREREERVRRPVRELPPAEELAGQTRAPKRGVAAKSGPRRRSARGAKNVTATPSGSSSSIAREKAGATAIPDKKPFNEEMKARWMNMRSVRLLLGIFLGLSGAYLAISFISYLTGCIVDQSAVLNDPVGYAGTVANNGGEGGARLSELLINDTFGIGSVVIIFWLIAMAMKQLAGRPKFKSVNFTIKCLVALITVSLIVGLVTIGADTSVNWGGLHGRYVNEFIIRFLGWTGAVFIALFMLACFVVICLRDVVNWVIRLKRKRDERKRKEREEREAAAAKAAARKADAEREALEAMEAGEAPAKEETVDQLDTYVKFGIEDDAHTPRTSTVQPSAPADEEEGYDSYVLTDEEEIARARTGKAAATTSGTDEYVLEESAEEKPKPTQTSADMPSDEKEDVQVVTIKSNTISESADVKTSKKGPASGKTYHFPPTDLLKPGPVHIEVDRDEQIAKQELIRQTLLDFGIPIDSIDSTVGPTVTLYEVVPSPGVKVSKINNLSDDIALRLKANGVRIIAPIPGRGTVGIEVANAKPQVVSMQRVLNSEEFQKTKCRLPIALGATIENKVYVADLAKMPHLLVAGATGQGKSVGLNAIITSLLYSKTPDELKFVLIDPKMVEFSIYAQIESTYLAKLPDSAEPIITDTKKVVSTLRSLCEEMENRYQLLKGNTRNIEDYNKMVRQGRLKGEDGHKFMPYIVVIIDEFADLMMLEGKEVEMPVARLAQKARAVGIHVIIATQRPSTQVITGNIKANFPSRISFKVFSGVDSKTILDQSGAQRLIGRGDMLISNNSELVRVQCAFVDTPEVEDIVDYVSSQPYAPGPYILPEPPAGADEEEEGISYAGTFMERDPLLPDAARSVVMSSQASTSSLQRRFSIGYNRAGKIMDQLEALGVVGPSNGSKSRSVLVDTTSIEEIIANM